MTDTPADDANLPKVGDVLVEKYQILRVLGRGGMGIVYEAKHLLLHQSVALKLLLSEVGANAEVVRRFENEARAAARIESEHVVGVKDLGVLENGMPFIVLEYLDGKDLSNILRDNGPLSTQDAADYVIQALDAIAHAHALGIVHRDLKPANLFVSRTRDGQGLVKVLDFGISKSTSPLSPDSGALTSTQAMLGSPYYMSPEQVRSSKSVDARADIWALGAILYEVLTGDPPHQGNSIGELFAAILEREVQSVRYKRPDVSPEFDAVVLRCLRRDPDQRFASVAELAMALAPHGTHRSTRLLERICAALPRPAAIIAQSNVSPHAASVFGTTPAPYGNPRPPPYQPPDVPPNAQYPGAPATAANAGAPGNFAPSNPQMPIAAGSSPNVAAAANGTNATWGNTSTHQPAMKTNGAKIIVPILLVMTLLVIGGGVLVVGKVISTKSNTTAAASGSAADSASAVATTVTTATAAPIAIPIATTTTSGAATASAAASASAATQAPIVKNANNIGTSSGSSTKPKSNGATTSNPQSHASSDLPSPRDCSCFCHVDLIGAACRSRADVDGCRGALS
jgi:serine/threonine protein kinase